MDDDATASDRLDMINCLAEQALVEAPPEHQPDTGVIASIEASAVLPLPESAAITPETASGASPWLDGYIQHSRRWSPRAYDDFHEAVGLWILSTVAARRVCLALGGERYTNLYISLAARTSLWAKTTTTQVGIDLLKEAGLLFLLAPDDATPQALIRSLVARLPPDWANLPREVQLNHLEQLAFAGQRGWYYDEFGQKVTAMMREGGTMADFRGLLRKFDNTPPAYEYVSVTRGSDKVIAPYLALLANVTPADLAPFAKRGAPLWSDGFWARFVFLTPPPGTPRKRGRFPVGPRHTPTVLVNQLRQWHQRLGISVPQVMERTDTEGTGSGLFDLLLAPSEPHRCRLGHGVSDAYYAYHDALVDIVEQDPNEDLDGNYSRMAEKALRVAMLLASLENGEQIELCHWARAQQIAEHWRANLHTLYNTVTAARTSQSEEMENKILRLIASKGPLTMREIYQNIRGLDATTAGIILGSMVRAALLEMYEEGRTQRYRLAG